MVTSWGNGASWQQDGGTHPHEANYLKLDISKAKARLDWQPCWALQAALQASVHWHQQWLAGANMQAVTLDQINQYQSKVL
jgi:CDP-glucose 4,6-dehydratase